MTTLIENIRADYLVARKERLPNVTATLSTLIGELESKAVITNGQKIIDDPLVISTVKKFIKNQETLLEHATGDAHFDAIAEIDLLKLYLPKQLSEDDLANLVTGNLSLGEYQGFLKKNYPGLYDAKLASELWKGVYG